MTKSHIEGKTNYVTISYIFVFTIKLMINVFMAFGPFSSNLLSLKFNILPAAKLKDHTDLNCNQFLINQIGSSKEKLLFTLQLHRERKQLERRNTGQC